MSKENSSFVTEKLQEKFKSLKFDYSDYLGDETIKINKDNLVSVITFLKNNSDLDFDMLVDMTCVDYMGDDERFEMVYHLYSVKKNKRIRVKSRVSEDDVSIDSLVKLYKIANWFEREVWDMYGIEFNGHPNLTRILLYEEFEGHPLRKDYPRLKEQPRITFRDQEK